MEQAIPSASFVLGFSTICIALSAGANAITRPFLKPDRNRSAIFWRDFNGLL
jgi:hypothetical protein